MNNISSMTGFGRAEAITDTYRLSVEIKSVNHRYLDLNIRMPRSFNCFEMRIRQLLKEYIERGKTDLFISFEDLGQAVNGLMYNKALAEKYLTYVRSMARDFSLKDDITAVQLSRYPEVFTLEDEQGDEEKTWQLLEPVLRLAASRFRETREREGDVLRSDLLNKLQRIGELRTSIEEASPSVIGEYRSRLKAKLDETLSALGLQADEGRLVTEVTIFSDKVCTDEEMVRLKSHTEAMIHKLQSGGACGRELDFIAQEMNREANTTLSKANSLVIADAAIALKTEIEKVREQVQNIE